MKFTFLKRLQINSFLRENESLSKLVYHLNDEAQLRSNYTAA